MAAPTKFTEAIAEEVCERIAAGESLNKIAQEAHLPEYRTFLRWLSRDDEPYSTFRAKYIRAREDQADYYADDIIDIADSADESNVQTQKLRVDARKWVASKLKPRKYGTSVAVGGPDGGPLEVRHTFADLIGAAEGDTGEE